MALNKERYHLIGTPRVYCDVPSYLRAIGKKMIRYSHWAELGQQWDTEIGTVGWNMNPTRQRNEIIAYRNHAGSENSRYYMTERIAFMEEFGDRHMDDNGESWIGVPLSLDLRRLLNNANYYGVLGHNLHTISTGLDSDITIEAGVFPNTWDGQTHYNYPQQTDILTLQDGDGTYLATTSAQYNHSTLGDEYCHGYRFNFYPDLASGDPEGKFFEIGPMTVGYYYDFPHSPNMSVSISYEFDGVKRTRTSSGSDITQIKYLRPKWGRFAPFTNTTYDNNQEFGDVSLQGRRVIDMSFDYLSESEVFPKNIHQNTFLQDNYDSSSGNYIDTDPYDEQGHNANILGNYLNLTLGGNLTHILQLDTNSKDFVLVKLDGKATKITQKAPKLYSCRLRFVEQF